MILCRQTITMNGTPTVGPHQPCPRRIKVNGGVNKQDHDVWPTRSSVGQNHIHDRANHNMLGQHDRQAWSNQSSLGLGLQGCPTSPKRQSNTYIPPIYQLASDRKRSTSCKVKVAPVQPSATWESLHSSPCSAQGSLGPKTPSSIRTLVLPNATKSSYSCMKESMMTKDTGVVRHGFVKVGRNLSAVNVDPQTDAVRRARPALYGPAECSQHAKQSSRATPLSRHTEPSSHHVRPSLHNAGPASRHAELSSGHTEPSSGHAEPSSGCTEPSSRHSEPKRGGCCVLLCVALVAGLLAMIFLSVALTSDSSHLIDVAALNRSLRHEVFGQHLVVAMLPVAIQQYASDSARPLIVSFHGWTGVGKTHVANIIASRVGASRLLTNVVRVLPMHVFQLADDSAQTQVTTLVTDAIHVNQLNLFIIDDVDQMPQAFMDGLLDLFSHWKSSVFNNDTKILVFLLSNAGSSEINAYLLEHLQRGLSRESVHSSELVARLLHSTAGRWYGRWHTAGVLGHILPFLPLERAHLHSCAQRYLAIRNEIRSADFIADVLQQINYFPAETPLFSITGCRQVSTKVDLLLDPNSKQET